jgi:hypothetical protein
VKTVMNLGFHKMLEFPRLAEQLLVSQEEFYSTALCWIRSSQSGDYQEHYLLICDAV